MMRGEISSLNNIIVRRCTFTLETLAGSGRRGKKKKLCELRFEPGTVGLSAERSTNWPMQATAVKVAGAAGLLVLRYQDYIHVVRLYPVWYFFYFI